MAPHSSTLAWKIPWMEEPGRLQSLGSQRVRHDWATSLSLFPGLGRSPGEGNGNPLQSSCLENPMGRGAWWATVPGVAKSWTWLRDFISLHFTRFATTFLPRSKPLLLLWLQSPSTMILEPPTIKSVTVSLVSPSICHEVMGSDA